MRDYWGYALLDCYITFVTPVISFTFVLIHCK